MMPAETGAVLVAYAFPPLNVIGAHRALRMARVLLERYRRVYVVGLEPQGLDPAQLDFHYGRDVLDNPRLIFLGAKPMLSSVEFSTRKSLPQRLLAALFCRLLCGTGVDWIYPLKRMMNQIPKDERISLVLATGHPFITFPAVVRWAADRLVPVVLDYRDLWTRNPRAPHPRIAKYWIRTLVERRANGAAAMLTTVSNGCKEILQLDASDTPVRVLLNSPDPFYVSYYENIARSFYLRRQVEYGRPLRIVLTGQVYPACTFIPLLQVLVELPRERLRRIEVHYYGGCSALARKEFQQFGLTDGLVDHGIVPKESAIEAILDADLLLSLIHTDAVAGDPAVTGLMTTKVYDYFLSGKPILNIGPVDADINAFAEAIGYTSFHSFSANDSVALRAFMERFLSDEGLNEITPLSVSIPSFADSLISILNEVEGMGK
jgi:hypothetical protein